MTILLFVKQAICFALMIQFVVISYQIKESSLATALCILKSVGNNLLGVLIEDVELVKAEANLNLVANLSG